MNDSARLIYHNDKLTLVIPRENLETIDFQKICAKAKYDKDFPPNVIKKVGKRYIICKSLTISNDSVNAESSTKSKAKEKYEINAQICFEYITFGEVDSKESLRIDFQHSVFKERVYFTNCEFNANVFFNHAVFHKYADFHESIFNGIVSFYNATFNSAPNFSTCVFSKLQGTDFINAKINKLKFATIKDFINEYENDKTHKDEIANTTDSKDKITKKHKIRYASNARDSFRTIKNVLIENNNLLDASNWHKLELYAKEQELKLQKPCLLTSPKKWCDLWQLKLYRKTSEHHTDLLKIWHTLMVLNGVFGLLFGLICLFGYCQIDLFKCVSRCLPCDYVFCNAGKICINTLLAFMFAVLFLCAVLCKIARYAFIGIGYLASFIILIVQPKYLLPTMIIFEHKESYSHTATISAVYTMLFILVIFSLQKTARKNSIIPN